MSVDTTKSELPFWHLSDAWHYRLRQPHYWLGWFTVLVYALLCFMGSIYGVMEAGLGLELALFAGFATLVANFMMFCIMVPILLHRQMDKDFSIYHKTRRAQYKDHDIYLKVKIKHGKEEHFEEVSETKQNILTVFVYGLAVVQSFLLTCFFVSMMPFAFSELFGTDIIVKNVFMGEFGPLGVSFGWGLLMLVFGAIAWRCNWTLTVYGAINYLNRHDFTLKNIGNIIRNLGPKPETYYRDCAHLTAFTIFACFGTYGLVSFFRAATGSTMDFFGFLFGNSAMSAASGLAPLLIAIGVVTYFPFATMAAYRGMGAIVDICIMAGKEAADKISNAYMYASTWTCKPVGFVYAIAYAIAWLPILAVFKILRHPLHTAAAINAAANGALGATGAPGGAESKAFATFGAAGGSFNTYVEGQHRKDDAGGELPAYVECALDTDNKSVSNLQCYSWQGDASYRNATSGGNGLLKSDAISFDNKEELKDEVANYVFQP